MGNVDCCECHDDSEIYLRKSMISTKDTTRRLKSDYSRASSMQTNEKCVMMDKNGYLDKTTHISGYLKVQYVESKYEQPFLD